MSIAINFLGRGKRLSSRSYVGADVADDLQNLVGQAVGVVGREVSEDAYVLATVLASEHEAASIREKTAMAYITVRQAGAGSILRAATSGKGVMGRQAGRWCSTWADPYEEDLWVAESVLAGELPDETRGARHWVHKTGFRTLTDYQAVCDRWYAAEKIVPVDLGGVSSLRIFLPESEVGNV